MLLLRTNFLYCYRYVLVGVLSVVGVGLLLDWLCCGVEEPGVEDSQFEQEDRLSWQGIKGEKFEIPTHPNPIRMGRDNQ